MSNEWKQFMLEHGIDHLSYTSAEWCHWAHQSYFRQRCCISAIWLTLPACFWGEALPCYTLNLSPSATISGKMPFEAFYSHKPLFPIFVSLAAGLMLMCRRTGVTLSSPGPGSVSSLDIPKKSNPTELILLGYSECTKKVKNVGYCWCFCHDLTVINQRKEWYSTSTTLWFSFPSSATSTAFAAMLVAQQQWWIIVETRCQVQICLAMMALYSELLK